MNAGQKVVKMLKEVYEDGEVNAAQVRKGYDVGTGRSGWHYQPFGETAQYMGKNLAEVQEYVEDIEASRESLNDIQWQQA
jgi:hypothetical protein